MDLYKINLNVVSVYGYFPTAIIASLIRGKTCMCELRVVKTWICGLNMGPNLTLRICSQLAATFVVQ